MADHAVDICKLIKSIMKSGIDEYNEDAQLLWKWKKRLER